MHIIGTMAMLENDDSDKSFAIAQLYSTFQSEPSHDRHGIVT